MNADEGCSCLRMPSVGEPTVPAAALRRHDQVEVRLRDGGVATGSFQYVDEFQIGVPPVATRLMWLDSDRVIDMAEVVSIHALPDQDSLRRVTEWVTALSDPDWAKRTERFGAGTLTARVPVSDHGFVWVTVRQVAGRCLPLR